MAFAQENAAVEGRVVNSMTREPIRKAQVTLELSQDAHDSSLVATTNEAGRFRFADIKPGRYELTAEKAGFLEGKYGRAKPEDQGLLLRVADADHLQGLTLVLFPGGTISGRVLDVDGDPVADNEVVLWSRDRRQGKISNSRSSVTNTNFAGEYRFDGLSAGTYFVSASAGTWGSAIKQVEVDSAGKPTRLHDLKTFYPAALSLADALAVHVESGQQQAGLDIRIQRGLTLSVKGRIAASAGSLANYTVSARVDVGNGWTSEAGKILPNGDFEFAALPPGKHSVSLLINGPNGWKVVGESDVTLVDQDLVGVMIAPFKPAQVRVKVVMEGAPDEQLSVGVVSLLPAEKAWTAVNMPMQHVPHNGIYVLDDVAAGKYQVWFSDMKGYYLKSVRSGERLLSAGFVEVTEGATLDLLVTFSRNVASVGGDVALGESVHVLLVANDEDALPQRKCLGAAMDQSGHFSVGDLRPGRYLAFAAEEDDCDLWENGEFVRALQSAGVELELHEKEHATIHLKPIPKDETDSLRRRLGI
jgi:hypothetical protein